ncbi:MAG: hypothetical protein JWO06_4083 [Bacteroidota bacterium]|nr:hypothetical protein [Bacteroidota bacterium]
MNNNYKSKFLFAFSFLITTSLFAQIPNAGFETWTSGSCTPLFTTYNYEDPNSWGTINVLTCQGGAFTTTKTADAHSGSYALQLSTISIFFQTAPGICATGTVNQTTQNIDGGFAINTRPSFLKGWYKYAPSGTDQFSVAVNFYTGAAISANVVGSGSFTTLAAANSYTEFTVPITYTSSATIDSAQITILCSYPDQNTAQAGSTAKVDDLFFVDCSSLNAANYSLVGPACTQSNGTITVNPAGGTRPYTYHWSNLATDSAITGLASGLYKLTLTDANGCVVNDSIQLNSVNTTFNLTVNATSTSCVSNTGTLKVIASGGTSPYTYHWGNGNLTDSISGLGAGNYPVTVTDSHGCTTTSSGTVSTNTGPSATDSTVNVLCFGDSTGQVIVTVSGGTAPLTYAWSNSDSTANISGLIAGTYTLTINDVNNCSFSLGANILQPASALTVNATVTNEECFGAATGSIILAPSGGTQPYSYVWNNLNNGNALINATSDLYIATVMDANHCVVVVTDSITQPSAINVVLSKVDASGAGNNGMVSAAVTGGTPAYTYVWNTLSTHDTITHLSPATYCVTVTDANHCSVVSCDSVSFTVGINVISKSTVKLYPNPASTTLTIEPGVDGKFRFSIFDLSGKAIAERTITGSTVNIDLRQYSEGLYTYRLINLSSGSVNGGKLQIVR